MKTLSLLLSALVVVLGFQLVGKSDTPSTAAHHTFGLNIKDFGAKGDGQTDDTAAFQRVLDAIAYTKAQLDGVSHKTKSIYIPHGRYRVTKTLKFDKRHDGIEFIGEGVPVPFRRAVLKEKGAPPAGTSTLVWGGTTGGTLISFRSCTGVRFSNLYLDGMNKAKQLVVVDSPRKQPFEYGASAHHIYERVLFANAEIGFQCGTDTTLNSANMSFYDCWFVFCTQKAFYATSPQHLLYAFHRCKVTHCEIAFHFEQGGCAKWSLCESYEVGTFLKIDSGGINAGTFHLDSVRPEPWLYKGKRLVLLDAEGEINVKFTSLCTTVVGLKDTTKNNMVFKADPHTPLFKLGHGVQVTVESSMLAGNLAEINGEEGRVPPFLQFINCRFRRHVDPRTSVKTNAFGGYQFLNCVVDLETKKPGGRFFIKDLSRYPKQLMPQ